MIAHQPNVARGWTQYHDHIGWAVAYDSPSVPRFVLVAMAVSMLSPQARNTFQDLYFPRDKQNSSSIFWKMFVGRGAIHHLDHRRSTLCLLFPVPGMRTKAVEALESSPERTQTTFPLASISGAVCALRGFHEFGTSESRHPI